MAQNANTVAIGGVEYAFKRVNLATMKKHLEFMRAGALAELEDLRNKMSAGLHADAPLARESHARLAAG